MYMLEFFFKFLEFFKFRTPFVIETVKPNPSLQPSYFQFGAGRCGDVVEVN